jgi:hypothetical protein
LHLLPLFSLRAVQVASVPLERLVEDSDKENWGLITPRRPRSTLSQLLEDENIALIRVKSSILKQFAQLINDDE